MIVLSRAAADAVVLVHFAFLVFLATGSLLAWRWPRLVAAHLPAVIWGLVSVTVGLDCPLTPLEKSFRRLAGDQGYAAGFVDRYIEGVVYPERYTPVLRVLIAVAVVAGYAGLMRRRERYSTSPTAVVLRRHEGLSTSAPSKLPVRDHR